MLKSTALPLRPTAFAAAAASLLLALPAQALVVLDTFGPGDTADGAGWSLFSDLPDQVFGQFLAVPFALGEASIVTDVLTSINGSGSYSLGIVAGAGLPSGAFVYSTVLTNPQANSGASNLNWALAAGDYWLVSRADPGASGTWRGGQQVGGGAWAFTLSASDTTWTFFNSSDAPAARVTVSAIPEPGTWALMFGGLALCAAAARRQRG
jgi:hypothetical protein